MSSTDPMKDGSLIRSEILQKISLRPSHFKELVNTKSSSSMRLITQQTTYNSYLGRLQRSFMGIVGLSSPATSKTNSLNPFIPDVPASSLGSTTNKNLPSQQSSSNDLELS